MKPVSQILISGVAAVLLVSCAVNTPAPEADSSQAAPVFQSYSLPAAKAVMPEPDPALEKYIDVLEGIHYDHVLPDGQRLDPFEDTLEEYPNEFAIFDVDFDGEDELLIRYTNTYTAGMFGAVYGYDRDTARLTTQLMEFPSLTFFPNGSVKASWSHNQGLAGRFWPGTFYRYDPSSDAYLPVAWADAWDREFYETDYDGSPFPAQADPNGNNIVYYVCRYADTTEPSPISQEEFDRWYTDLIGFDPALHDFSEYPLVIPYQSITEETIFSLS